MSEPRVLAWFSAGTASAIAAAMALRQYGHDRVLLVRCETNNEDPDNLRFEREVSTWLGKSVTVLASTKYESVWDVWTQRRYMAGPDGAPCTMYMKVMPRLEFQRPDDIHIFGYTADTRDAKRFVRLKENYFELTVKAPLIEAGVTKAATLQMVKNAGITPPRSYDMGFPNANCLRTGCVKASSANYWSLYRFHFPENCKRTAELSREIGKKLVQLNGERIYLDELPEDHPMTQPIAPACDFLCSIAEQDLESND